MRISSLLLWVVSAILLIALLASLSEVMRLKGRIGELTKHEFHDHAEVRRFMIQAALADTQQPIVVFGDSIAEMAPFPHELCGRPVINAGIGGMTIAEASRLAPRLLSARSPFMVIVVIGGNDIGSITVERDYSDLLRVLTTLSPRVLAASPAINREMDGRMSLAAIAHKVLYLQPPLPPDSKMADGIHFTNAAYRAWLPVLETAIVKECE